MPDDQPTALPRAQVPAADTPGPNGLLGLAVGVVVVAALYLGREVLVPITLAVLLSFVLAPVVSRLRRFGLPRVPSVLLTVIAALAVILLIGGLLGTQLASLAQQLPNYQETIEQKVGAVRKYTVDRVAQFADGLTPAPPPTAHQATPNHAQAAPAGPKVVPVEVQQQTSPLELVERFVSPLLGPLGTLGVVLIVAIFILLQQDDLRDRLIRLFGSSDLHRTTAAMDDAGRRLSKYFLTQLGINTSFGVIIGLGLGVIGVPNPLLWGILAALLRFVPYVGSFIAGVLPVVLAASVEPGWSMALWTLALFVIVESIMGQAVEPLVYGHSTGLSPVAVIVAAIFWSWIWGPIGLILSTPLTLCLVVLGRHVKRLEFLDVILGDRPALTPIENFYQRILAGDADEAQEHAEALLRDRPLSSYYDEVAMKGLQLAASDLTRGVLTDKQLARIKTSIGEIVAELADFGDGPEDETRDDEILGSSQSEQALPRPPAPEALAPESLLPGWRVPMPVLCVAGRGALDEAAAMMLAQLLGKHGLGARVVPYDAVARDAIVRLDPGETVMVCVSYLEITGHPTHLRSLLRRLRQRIPGARLLVGLWPADEAVVNDADLRRTVGADDYVSSLRDAVNACVEAAQSPTVAVVAA